MKSSRPAESRFGAHISRRGLARMAATGAGVAVFAWGRGTHASGASDAGVGPIRLGSNENPTGPGPAALAAIAAGLPQANRYPYDVVSRLQDAIAAAHGVDADWVAMSPGSGDILRAATTAFTSPSRVLVAASPTFETPARTAAALGVPVRSVPVDASGALDLKAMSAHAAGAGLFFVCNPNNPTGGVSTAEAVTAFVAAVRSAAPDAVLLMDEAYHEYVDRPGYVSAMPMVHRDARVIVSRTFSKIHGMAGLRVGYAVGQPATLATLRRALSQGTISNVSAAAALASLGDADHLARQRDVNREAKKFTRDAFERAGFAVLPSEANFLMVDIRRPVEGFAGQCRHARVLIARPFPPLRTHARISIGTPEEMRRAVSVMLPLLAAAPSARHAVPDPETAWPVVC